MVWASKSINLLMILWSAKSRLCNAEILLFDSGLIPDGGIDVELFFTSLLHDILSDPLLAVW